MLFTYVTLESRHLSKKALICKIQQIFLYPIPLSGQNPLSWPKTLCRRPLKQIRVKYIRNISISFLNYSTQNKLKHNRPTFHYSIDNHIFCDCSCMEYIIFSRFVGTQISTFVSVSKSKSVQFLMTPQFEGSSLYYGRIIEKD